MAKPKGKMDTAQLAKYVVDVASGALPNESRVVTEGARARGRARAASLSPRKRQQIAKKAAAARWGGKK